MREIQEWMGSPAGRNELRPAGEPIHVPLGRNELRPYTLNIKEGIQP